MTVIIMGIIWIAAGGYLIWWGFGPGSVKRIEKMLKKWLT